MMRRPLACSRLSPEAVIEPSGKARAAATESLSGESGLTLSRVGWSFRAMVRGVVATRSATASIWARIFQLNGVARRLARNAVL